jgi:hypothetical protein
MGVNFLSARSWAVFLGCEFILAGCLIVLGAFSGAVLIVVGAVLLGSLWAWDHRRPLVRSALARVGVPDRWLTSLDEDRKGFSPIAPSRPDMPFIRAANCVNTHPAVGPGKDSKRAIGLLLNRVEATKMLERAARRGELSVWGAVETYRSRDESGQEVRQFAASLESIPQTHWATHGMEDCFQDGRSYALEQGNMLVAQVPTYARLWFNRAEVEALWPPLVTREAKGA